MNWIIRLFGMLPFQEEQLLKMAADRSGAEHRVALLELRRQGMVRTVRQGWGERHHYVPQTVYREWQMLALAHCPEPEPAEPSGIALLGDEQTVPPLGQQLIHAWSALFKCGMKRTAKGLLPKRALDRAGRQLAFDEAHSGVLPWKPVAGEKLYSFPIMFMLDLAARKEWLVEQGRHMALSGKWRQWLALPDHRREELLYGDIAAVYASWTAASAAAALRLSRLQPWRWYRLEQWSNAEEYSAIVGWCRLMRAFGWLEEAADLTGHRLFRWLINPLLPAAIETASPDDPEPVKVLPDGEIFVPVPVTGEVRWQLEMIAERKRCDVMTVYQLNEQTMKEAAASGLQVSDIVRILENSSKEPLPASIRIAIEGWCSRAADEQRPTGLISAAACTGKQAPQRPAAPLFVHPGDVSQFQQVAETPRDEVIFPGLDAIPLIWRREMRNYHLSTRKLLVEQAIAWQTPVQIVRNGATARFIPDTMEKKGEAWLVSGRSYERGKLERQILSLDMWEEMKLFIPIDLY